MKYVDKDSQSVSVEERKIMNENQQPDDARCKTEIPLIYNHPFSSTHYPTAVTMNTIPESRFRRDDCPGDRESQLSSLLVKETSRFLSEMKQKERKLRERLSRGHNSVTKRKGRFTTEKVND